MPEDLTRYAAIAGPLAKEYDKLKEALEHHGEESGAEYEVGDYIEVLDEAFRIMTPEQRQDLLSSFTVTALMEMWGPGGDDD